MTAIYFSDEKKENYKKPLKKTHSNGKFRETLENYKIFLKIKYNMLEKKTKKGLLFYLNYLEIYKKHGKGKFF